MVTSISSLREERAIAEVRRISHAGLDAPELLRRAARAMQRVVPFDMYAAATIDPASKLITSAFAEQLAGGNEGMRPVNPRWFERYYFGDTYEKTIDRLARGQWVTTLDDETHGNLELSQCYRETMRPAGIAHKAHAIFVDRNLWGDLDLYRGDGSPAFSPSELDLLRRVAPEIGTGLKFATLRARGAVEDVSVDTPGVLVVDDQGRITATPTAERLLAELGELRPGWRDGRNLPVPIQVVLAALRRTLESAPAATEQSLKPQLLVRARSGRWFTLHAAATEASADRRAEQVVIVAPARPEEVAWLGMAAYGLSPREEEVVKLVIGGLSTKQISDRLFIAEHTVQRHLSNIFEKVGVRGRRALVKQVFVEHLLPNMN